MRSAVLLLVSIGAALVACTSSPSPSSSATPEHDRARAANACATCHRADFDAVKHPLHPGAKPTTCAVCHTQESWHPSVLRHEWPLTGAHAKVDCFGCHRGNPPVFQGTGKACVDCHRDDAANVKFAEHATFGTACETCHTTTAWKPAKHPPDAGEEASKAKAPETPAPVPTSPKAKPPRPKAAPKPKPDVVTSPSPRW